MKKSLVNKLYYICSTGVFVSCALMLLHIASVIVFEKACGSVEYRDTLGMIVGVGLLGLMFLFYVIVETIDVKKAEKESEKG